MCDTQTVKNLRRAASGLSNLGAWNIQVYYLNLYLEVNKQVLYNENILIMYAKAQ